MVSLTMSARGVTAGHEAVGGRPWWRGRGETARGRPPSPLLGAGYVMAAWWIAFGSALLQQWACG
jgi:hypothetical protein